MPSSPAIRAVVHERLVQEPLMRISARSIASINGATASTNVPVHSYAAKDVRVYADSLRSPASLPR